MLSGFRPSIMFGIHFYGSFLETKGAHNASCHIFFYNNFIAKFLGELFYIHVRSLKYNENNGYTIYW